MEQAGVFHILRRDRGKFSESLDFMVSPFILLHYNRGRTRRHGPARGETVGYDAEEAVFLSYLCPGHGQMAITQAVTGDYDLILLDLMLPGCSGYDVCRVIRDKTDVPILMVTARTESVDKIRGLGLGADDYVAKPFDPAELVARVKAHLARYQRLTQGGQRAENGQVIRVADVEIYPQSWKVYKAGRELKMPNREFELLKFLAEHPNIVFSKDRLFETIWGFDYVGDSATVTVHVGRIRDKIEDDPSKPRIIETVWGAGYRLNAKG